MIKFFKHEKIFLTFIFLFSMLLIGLMFFNIKNKSVYANESQKVLTLSEIKDDKNNVESEYQGYSELVLCFGSYGNDYFFSTTDKINLAINIKTWDNTNYAANEYEIGNNLTINGVSISKLKEYYPNTKVDYSLGYNYMYICYPDCINKITDEYRFPVLKITNGTTFVDNKVSEVSLSLIAGSWVNKTFSNMKDIDDYLTLSDGALISSSYSYCNTSMAIAYGLNTGGDKMRFIMNFNNNDKANISIEVYGYTLSFDRNTIKLLNSGNVLCEYSGLSIKCNQDFILELDYQIKRNGKIVVGIDHAKVFEYSTTYINSDSTAIWMLATGTAKITISDYQEKEIYDSTISLDVDHIDLNEGDTKGDLESLFTAFNIYDNSVNSSLLSFNLEDGAIINNKYQKGVWKLTASLPTTGIKKATTKTLILNINGETTNAQIYFDGIENGYVVIGDKVIEPITKPAKESDDDYDYYFDGWYVDEKEWDFNKDVVTKDTYFVSKYSKQIRHYSLFILYKGIDKESHIFKLEKNFVLNKDYFFDEDYQVTIYLDNNSVNNILMDSDKTIIVEYKKYYEHHDAVLSTCIAHGNVEYWTSFLNEGVYYGDSKGQSILESIEAPLLNHKYLEPTYTWNKVNDEYECIGVIKCSVCKEKISETVTTTSKISKNTSCKETGIKEYTATFENKNIDVATKEEKIDKLEHKYVHVDEVPPTKEETGIMEHYYCSECHEYFIFKMIYLNVDYDSLIMPVVENNNNQTITSGCFGGIYSKLSISLSLLIAGIFIFKKSRKEDN